MPCVKDNLVMTAIASPIRRRYLFALCLATALSTVQPAFALSKSEEVHARSAFTFADKKDWGNARQHATASHDSALKTLIQWQYLLDTDSGATFGEITRFIKEHSEWPEQKKLRLRAEFSLRDDKTPDSEIISWFGEESPITGVGKIALAEALARKDSAAKERVNYLLRDAWRNGDFDESQEAAFLSEHGALLTPEDEAMRIDRLLWEEKLSSAERMLPRVHAPYRQIAMARMALQDQKNAGVMLATLNAEMKKNAGLLYDLIRYQIRRDDEGSARNELEHLPEHLPYPEKWWKLREAQVRRAIDEKKYEEAQRLLEGYKQLSGSEFADASWLHGWLLLEFLKKPAEAKDAFKDMYENVKFPVSRARAAYWTGRAADSLGETESARSWYATAAAYPTSFYGQLASLKMSENAPLYIPPAPDVSDSVRQKFEKGEIARAVAIAVEMGQSPLATRLLGLVIDNTEDNQLIVAAAHFGQKLGKDNLSVRVAKKAMQQNIVMLDAGYPRPRLPKDLPVEDALALAITRQESEFDPQAKSRAGATGMMQLLPSTAKEVAKKASLGFKHARLIEPGYNMTLGSHYLARLIRNYDGSYVMAIAAYNAGPGNVRNWREEFGSPGKNIEAAVDWIEKIPFYETRNYVQRVMENLQVYRHLLAHEAPPLDIGKDLVR